ncbi:S8 family serine peptidase [Bacillus suaedae]|uniref:S8 family serine peptidase n=1 Tax=Halalkalibacter suaedae TaxID=2822140 RepID=A0A940WTT6_9BACI|nr:S8 family serine peptidase [Bacillus suaedae]MBP3950317.1 S8 family serine peptidase [Bacillus suaedae]
MKRVIFALLVIGISIFFFLYFHFKNIETHYQNDLEKLASLQGEIVTWGLEVTGIDKEIGKNVKVAILDSGINKMHEDLEGKIVGEYNAIEPNTPIVDEFGHGTAIAGIITANSNDKGIVGVTQNVELYDVKVLDELGKGSVDNFIDGIEWCIENNIEVINVSFGLQSHNMELKKVIDKAISSGIIIIGAAGNNYGLTVDYPARYTDVISINSLNEELKRSSTAARGKIDFISPGVDILSTDKNGDYSLFTGTSFATAYATGVISTIIGRWEEDSEINSYELMEYLASKSLKPKTFTNENEYGKGILIIP